jgi:iron(III) transport system permease protein
MLRIKNKLEIWSFVTLFLAIILAVFLIYPFANILRESVVTPEGNFTLSNFSRFFGDPYYFNTIWNSTKVTLIVTLTSVLLALPLSYFYTFYLIKGRKIIFIASLLCAMSAPFIGAYAWVMLMGRSGVVTLLFDKLLGFKIGNIYGFWGIILVQTLKFFPLVFIYMNGAFRNIDNSLMEASESMGCTGVSRFFRILLRLSMPTLLAAALMVFMRAFADFGTPLLIGEGYRTFTVEIYNQYMGEVGTDHSFAATISIIAIIVTTLIFLAQKFAAKRFAFSMNMMNPVKKKTPKGISSVLMHLYSYILIGVAILPQAYIIYLSFQNCTGSVFKEGYSFDNYIIAMNKYLGESLKNSLMFGVIAMVAIIVLAILISYVVVRRQNAINNTIDVVSMLPYVVPGAVVGIALIISFNSKPISIVGTMWIMILALVMRRLPYTVRSATATLMQTPISLEEASISLGASKLKTLTSVTVPLMTSGIVSGAILSWIAIITELSSGIILYNNRNITLTVGTYVQIVRGNYGVACAYAAVLTVLTVLSMILFLRVSKSEDVNI